MKNKLFIALLLPLLVLVACTTEGGGKESSSSSSSEPIVSSSSSSKLEESTSSTTPKVELPSDAQAFVDAVDSIVLNYDSGKDINDAFVLYDNLENWDYDEVIDAFNRLVALEELYNDYVRLSNGVEAFITRVDEIPYDLSINDERLIVLAEDAYSKLNDEQKAMLGVSQAYDRLVDARNDFDALFAATIEAAKKEAAKGFTDLVDALPSVELVTLKDGISIEGALSHYEGLDATIKEMVEVVEAYNKLVLINDRYTELVNNPSINDEIMASVFLDSVSKLPEVENVTLGDIALIEKANNDYK